MIIALPADLSRNHKHDSGIWKQRGHCASAKITRHRSPNWLSSVHLILLDRMLTTLIFYGLQGYDSTTVRGDDP